MIIAAVLGAALFGLAGYIGVLLGHTFAEKLEWLPYGPPPVHAPEPILVVGCAAIGAALTTHMFAPIHVLLIAIVCIALVAIWIVDARKGIVPDVFTLGPLALLLIVALWQHTWWHFAAAAIPLVPFAAAALVSRGRGMGWGDVKLVALGGVVLGVQLSILAFAAASLTAFAVNYALGRKRGGPIAFAPYLATAIGLAIPAGVIGW